MCGRFTQVTAVEKLAAVFRAARVAPEAAAVGPRYNLAPSQSAILVRGNGEARSISLGRWGFVPSWSRDPSRGVRPINARIETAAEKPLFRSALRQNRCLVPCDGFYEWQVLDATARTKRPWYIRVQGSDPFALAGLWSPAVTAPDPAGDTLDFGASSPVTAPAITFTILTTTPNALMSPIHNRMPVIVRQDLQDAWLAEGPLDASLLAQVSLPFDAGIMEARGVGAGVNNPRRDDSTLIAP